MLWEIYNRGPVSHLIFLDDSGIPLKGKTIPEWEKMHGICTGLRNKATGAVIIINERGYVAARTEDPYDGDRIEGYVTPE